MKPHLPSLRRGRTRHGAALIIVLAFVVLLAGLVVAFFSNSLLYRQISNSSASQAKVDLFAQGAVDTIIGDLKEEIAAGSNATLYAAQTQNGAIVGQNYQPLNAAASVPALALKGAQNTVTSFAANLVKRSAYQQNFYPANSDAGATNYRGSTLTTISLPSNNAAAPSSTNYVPSNRAAQIPSTTAAQNGRYVSETRWNKALLLPKANVTSDTDLKPDLTNFVVPDWILTARDGSNPGSPSKAASFSGAGALNDASIANKGYVIGRYAYAMYDEGGLLDANVAGFPVSKIPYASDTIDLKSVGSKGALAFADLTQLPGLNGLSATRQQAVIDGLVGWRNFASAQASGSLVNGYTFASASPSPWPYSLAVLGNSNGFLKTSSSVDPQSTGGQTDRMFSSRQEMMKLLLNGVAQNSSERASLQNALQYLGTFSRGLSQPSYAPVAGRPTVLSVSKGGNNAAPDAPGVSGPLDDKINPSFLKVRVQATKTGGRNDGTDLMVGEPLVKKRFALSRLAWLTYAGPITTDGTSYNSGLEATYIPMLKANSGLSDAFLLQGTPDNIQKYFGLTWSASSSGYVWKYNVHNGASGTGSTGSIMKLGDLAALPAATIREPDFFELLKASINVGSLGKSAVANNSTALAPTGYAPGQVPSNYRYGRDTSVDYQIIQIGANIIDQSDIDSYPTRIVFDDGSLPAQEFDGVEDLPYLAYIVNGMLRTEAPSSTPTSFQDNPHQWGNPVAGSSQGSAGKGVMLQVPALWNPHDVSGSKGTPWRPANFRVVADSADPITVANSGAYNKVYVAAVAHNADGSPAFSYNASGYGMTGQVLNSSNTALTFSDSNSQNPNGKLFREPTLLLRQGGDINLQSAGYPAGIKSIDLNPVVAASDPPGTGFLGIVIGTFPLEFSLSTNTTLFAGQAIMGPGGIPYQPLVYLTYRVQYRDPSGNWITYDTKYGRAGNGLADFNWNLSANNGYSPTIIESPDAFIPWSWSSSIDPRSARFGLFSGATSLGVANENPVSPADNSWIADPSGTIDPRKGIAFTVRPDKFGGIYFVDFNTRLPGDTDTLGQLGSADDPVLDNPFPRYEAGWARPVVHAYWGKNRYEFAPGMFEQNNTGAAFYIRRDDTDSPSGNDEFGKTTGNPQPSYYADADGVVRRAMGAYIPTGGAGLASAANTIGLPLAITQKSTQANLAGVTDPTKSFNQAQSRPLILNRPFRSQGELGYVFRDTAWKNLDFSTPESGDTALLDVFCASDTDDSLSRVAGKVNLNTKQTPVIAAVLSNAYIDDPKVTDATVGTLSVSPSLTAVNTIATALTARVMDTSASGGPMQNVSELVGKWVSAQPITAPTAYIPQNPQTGWPPGGDLLASDGYKDGKLSYTGFSGSPTATNPVEDLNTAYGNATFSTSAGNNASLRTGMSQIKRFHEAPIRALTSVGQTRVWNLMIDVVAQTGRYPQSATSLDKFLVEGEQRYWVHVSVDRLTGQVIDKQIEVVKE